MRKTIIIFIVLLVISFNFVATYAATTDSLGSNVKAALTQSESDSETAYSHLLDATKSDHKDPSGYMKYIKIDIDSDSNPELITITTNESNGKTLYFYTLVDSNPLFLGKKDFKDASYPIWFFQDKGYIVIDDTVEGFFRVQLIEGELKITSITDYPVDKEHQLAPLLYDEQLPMVNKNESSLDQKVQNVLKDESFTDLKNTYKAVVNAFIESNPVIVDQEEEIAGSIPVSYILYDINNDNVSELIVITNNAYLFTFNNGLVYLGSIYFQNSSFEKTGDGYLTVFTGKNDYYSYRIKMTTTNISLEHTYDLKDTDFNPYSKKIINSKTELSDIDALQNNPTKSVIKETPASKTLPIAIGVAAFIIFIFIVGMIMFLKMKK